VSDSTADGRLVALVLMKGEQADATIDVPCFAYLLTAPGRTVLVDTGPDVEVARRAGFEVQ